MAEKSESANDRITSAERRSDVRVISIYRPIVIECGDFIGFCLVRNISSGGLMGMVYATLPINEPVRMEFQPDLVLSGKIMWSGDRQIGVAFDEPVDLETIITRMSAKYSGHKVSRSPRVTISCPGMIELKEGKFPVELKDISQGGAKISGPFVAQGEELSIEFEGLPPRKAVVRWRRGRITGLTFLQPVPLDMLGSWVIDQQGKEAA